MIERLAARAARREAVPAGDKARLQARSVLDGFGTRHEPSERVELLPAGLPASPPPLSEGHPPGLYGDPVNGYISARNLGDVLVRRGELPEKLGRFPRRTVRYDFTAWDDNVDFTHWLILVALIFLAVDVVVVAWRRGSGSLRRRASLAITAGVMILPLLVVGADAKAQNIRYRAKAQHDKATETVQKFRLAYVRTGDAETDRISERGLQGLSKVLTTRTTVEPGAPIGVDPGIDDLSLLPFLYWPSPKIGPTLTGAVEDAVRNYLRSGGMILFDTRNRGSIGAGRGDLRALSDLLPPLVPLPSNHVLTRSYYLLKSFPGRLGDETIWVEAGTAPPPDKPDAANAGIHASSEHISSVIWGDNDWAGHGLPVPMGRRCLPCSPTTSASANCPIALASI